MSEPSIDAQLTALVLRDIAAHLARDEAMNLAGAWRDDLRDPLRPAGRWARRHYDQGRRAQRTEVLHALRWIADHNDPLRDGTESDQ